MMVKEIDPPKLTHLLSITSLFLIFMSRTLPGRSAMAIVTGDVRVVLLGWGDAGTTIACN